MLMVEHNKKSWYHRWVDKRQTCVDVSTRCLANLRHPKFKSREFNISQEWKYDLHPLQLEIVHMHVSFIYTYKIISSGTMSISIKTHERWSALQRCALFVSVLIQICQMTPWRHTVMSQDIMQ